MIFFFFKFFFLDKSPVLPCIMNNKNKEVHMSEC